MTGRCVRDASHQRSSARATDREAVTVNEMARHEETASHEEGRSGAAISWLSWDPCIYYIAWSTTARAHVRAASSFAPARFQSHGPIAVPGAKFSYSLRHF